MASAPAQRRGLRRHSSHGVEQLRRVAQRPTSALATQAISTLTAASIARSILGPDVDVWIHDASGANVDSDHSESGDESERSEEDELSTRHRAVATNPPQQEPIQSARVAIDSLILSLLNGRGSSGDPRSETMTMSLRRYQTRTPPAAPPPLESDMLPRNPGKWDSKMDGIASWLTCPITLEAFRDPVIAVDGCTYERASIERWFARNGPTTSPCTNQLLPTTDLIPNHAIRSAVEAEAKQRGAKNVSAKSGGSDCG